MLTGPGGGGSEDVELVAFCCAWNRSTSRRTSLHQAILEAWSPLGFCMAGKAAVSAEMVGRGAVRDGGLPSAALSAGRMGGRAGYDGFMDRLDIDSAMERDEDWMKEDGRAWGDVCRGIFHGLQSEPWGGGSGEGPLEGTLKGTKLCSGGAATESLELESCWEAI